MLLIVERFTVRSQMRFDASQHNRRFHIRSSARHAQSTLAPRSIEKVVVVLVVVVVGFCC